MTIPGGQDHDCPSSAPQVSGGRSASGPVSAVAQHRRTGFTMSVKTTRQTRHGPASADPRQGVPVIELLGKRDLFRLSADKHSTEGQAAHRAGRNATSQDDLNGFRASQDAGRLLRIMGRGGTLPA